MKRIFAFLAAFTMSLTGRTLEVSRNGDHLFLKAPSCVEAKDQVAALAQWTLSLNETPKCHFNPLQARATQDPCTVDITECVPKQVAQYHGTTAAFSGPNCWNLALVVKNILPGLRYSKDEEIEFYLREPLCQKLKTSDQPRPGDIGIISDGHREGSGNLHGFIYVSDKLAYSKNGHETSSAFGLQPLNSVFDIYKIPMPCRGPSTTSNSNECPISASYFRCQSLNEYLNTHPIRDKTLMKHYEKLNNFELCMQNHAIHGDVLTSQAKQSVIDVARALTQYAKDEKKNPSSNMPREERDFILGSLQLRIEAIAQQYIFHHDVQAADDLLLLTGSLRHSVSELNK